MGYFYHKADAFVSKTLSDDAIHFLNRWIAKREGLKENIRIMASNILVRIMFRGQEIW